ncbi:hypothetical protein HJC23_003659 [Cyclotella cryptica]|uniref:peptidylprolyl isomerase n=1 Tax=Cyclotella cryptica TaxID=29204 RepID=A0ABD3QIS1_9STRA|eukprot:CCRYP_004956-RA/>CCRYP_004956-RA protein AED:0.10 eAED:0.10 QI:205/1/1/1/1/1/2/412/300
MEGHSTQHIRHYSKFCTPLATPNRAPPNVGTTSHTKVFPMGRRKRLKNEDDADDDTLDNYEREWLSQRKSSKISTTSKRQKITDDAEAKQIVGKNDVSTNSPTISDAKTSSNDIDTKGPTGVTEEDKVERMRLKRQRHKERRKEKKAIATTNEERKRKCKSDLERRAEKENRLLIEKNKKSKEKHPVQSFRALHKGVKYLDLVVGKGPTVQHRKKVRVSYTLRAKSHTTGKILDSSHNFGFRLGKGEVIHGWDIGLEGMRVGGIRRLIVPPLAGYGNNKDVGAGRGGDLFFEIELLHVAP